MASKNKRRKKRYRVHKGRIIVVLLVLIALVIGGIFAIKHLSKAGYSSESGFRITAILFICRSVLEIKKSVMIS